MNPLKIRVWCKGWKPPRMANLNEFSTFGEKNFQYVFEHLYSTPLYVPMLFTGLYDKNGFEIYDGDLIKAGRFPHGDTYGPYRVFWDKDIAGWCSCVYDDAELVSSYKNIEIVGHIFDGTKYEGTQ